MFANHIRNEIRIISGNLCVSRRFCQKVMSQQKHEFTEVEIDVPWGKIAGKLWGSSKKQPILAVHGWMDNAGSFDYLVPLLKNCSVLAIDLPGNGRSSWLPQGFFYDELVNLQAIHRVKSYFGWDKVKLLAHSAGGILSFIYASLYPQETQFVISIDSLTYRPVNVPRNNEIRRQIIPALMNFETIKTPPPSYPENVAVDRWIKAVNFSVLTEDMVRTLMIRGTKKKEDGAVYFSRDMRLKIIGTSSGYSADHLTQLAKQITSPYLVIKASESVFDKAPNYWVDIPEVMKKNNKYFNMKTVEGTHHVHMINPNGVAEVINPFIEKYSEPSLFKRCVF